jgi:hypothetical protein
VKDGATELGFDELTVAAIDLTPNFLQGLRLANRSDFQERSTCGWPTLFPNALNL